MPAITKPSPRDRLLHAATELFYGEGVQSVGIDRVIAHPGVAKASLSGIADSQRLADRLRLIYDGGSLIHAAPRTAIRQEL
jgi:hypothetical protein